MLSMPVYAQSNLPHTEVDCLAKNIYHEARGESELGQKAVAWVTLNRTENPSFPDTVCGVVLQSHQFSWVTAKLKVKNRELYMQIRELAEQMMAMHAEGIVPEELIRIKDALYFDSLMPRRARKSVRIGHHNFYMR